MARTPVPAIRHARIAGRDPRSDIQANVVGPAPFRRGGRFRDAQVCQGGSASKCWTTRLWRSARYR